MKTLHTVILSVILLSPPASCSRRHRAVHREIDRISAIADVDPDSALRLLDSMAPTLAADDNLLMHHRLILVKARDKAAMSCTKPLPTRSTRASAATSMPNPPAYTIVKIC